MLGAGAAATAARCTRRCSPACARGFHMATAGTTRPNEASEAFHRAMGFEAVGTYRRIGFKRGAWRDVAWTQKALVDGDLRPDGA